MPLLPEGEERARRLRPRLAGETFVAAYSSPLQRAVRTAELAGYPDAIREPLLAEWDYGDYDGITTAQIRQQRPDWNLWRDGCPGGESFEHVAARATRFLETVARSGAPLITFSHGHFLRVLAVVFLGLPKEAGARLSLETAALSVLRRDGQECLLALWNDTGHLPGLPT